RLRRLHHRPESRGARQRQPREAGAAPRADRAAAQPPDPLLRALGHRQAARSPAASARRRRLPESRGHIADARGHGGPRRGRPPGARAVFRWPVLRNRTGIVGHERHGRGRRHGDRRGGGHLRRSLDARAPGPRWMIVNDVAGFIGPEVFATAAQLERACLEDVVMAKLQGLTMGLDVCSTFHMGIAPRDLRDLTRRIARNAAPAYLMAVAGNSDPMLGYLTTAFRDHPSLRSHAGRRMTTAMEERLRALGAIGDDNTGPATAVARLYAAYMKAGGDRRTSTALEEAGGPLLGAARDRGFDLGLADQADADRRVEAIYAHARAALYSTVEEAVVRDATRQSVRVRSAAADRDDYLAHPPAGERLADDGVRAIAN